jgi:drug/metabolite transporter (DMT)-like permease
MNFKEKYKDFVGASLVFWGAVLFSGKAVLVKIAYFYPVDAVTLLTLRMLFSLPFFIIIALSNKRKKAQVSLNKKDWLSIILLGFVGYYLASLFDFLGLQYITAGLERLILFVYPTLVLLLSAIFLKKKIKQREYLALALTYFGVFFVFYHDLSLTQNNVILGSVLVFLSALTYAIYIMGSGELIPKLGSVRFTALAMIVSSIAVLLHYVATHSISEWQIPQQVYMLGLGMAIFSTVLPAFMVSAGIKLIGSGRSSIIGSIGPISTIILAFIFLDEAITLPQTIGTFLVLAGVIIVGRKEKKQEPQKATA